MKENEHITTVYARDMYDLTQEPNEKLPETILQEAERLINGPRREDYGDVQNSFEVTRKLWCEVLDTDDLTANEVVLCMIQLKIARLKAGIKRDTIVDIAGYAGLLGKLNGFE